MSLIGDRLQTWLKYYNSSTSIMRQASTSICEILPPATKDRMVDISIDSAMYPGEYQPQKVRERGAPITQDYTLGEVRIGSRDAVAIPRPEGTIGTYHSHPWGSPFPSSHDVIDTLDKDDKIMCIGATGKSGTKIQCFTPNKPKWSGMQYKLRLLADDIKDYNNKLGRKYKQRGVDLERLLDSIGSPTYREKIEYTTPEQLREEAARAERSAKVTEEAVKIADIEAVEAAEIVKIAQMELDKATTKEEINMAEINLRSKEDGASRAMAKMGIERRLAMNARVTANRATFIVERLALGKAQATAESKQAIEFLREGANLAGRREVLRSEIKLELRHLATPGEWMVFKHGKHVPYFEAFPNIFTKCRIIWEGFDEDLPFEL